MQTIEITVPANATDAAITKAVEQAARAIGLGATLRTSSSSYPGSVHWHFKKETEKRGTLELTYWPEARKLWAKIQAGRTAEWIDESLTQLASEFSHQISLAT